MGEWLEAGRVGVCDEQQLDTIALALFSDWKVLVVLDDEVDQPSRTNILATLAGRPLATRAIGGASLFPQGRSPMANRGSSVSHMVEQNHFFPSLLGF